MAAINIAFDIPQSTHFSVDEFRKRMTAYGNRLIAVLAMPTAKPVASRLAVGDSELAPVVREILSLSAPLAGTVSENDINGDEARTAALNEKYGIS